MDTWKHSLRKESQRLTVQHPELHQQSYVKEEEVIVGDAIRDQQKRHLSLYNKQASSSLGMSSQALEAKQLARSTHYRWIRSSWCDTTQLNPSGMEAFDTAFVSCLPDFFPSLHIKAGKGFFMSTSDHLCSREGVWANCPHAASSPPLSCFWVTFRCSWTLSPLWKDGRLLGPWLN